MLTAHQRQQSGPLSVPLAPVRAAVAPAEAHLQPSHARTTAPERHGDAPLVDGLKFARQAQNLLRRWVVMGGRNVV